MTILTARDIAERYRCSLVTARRYIRQMRHMENPLTVYEEDLIDWERSRIVPQQRGRAVRVDTPMVVSRTR